MVDISVEYLGTLIDQDLKRFWNFMSHYTWVISCVDQMLP